MKQERILIIKLAAIGDVVMATPAFATIRRKHPAAHITLLVGAWAAPIVERDPSFDEMIVVDENIFWKKRVLPLLRLLLRLRRGRYDTAYVMHWSGFFNLFALLAGARSRIGFSRQGARTHFLTCAVPFSEGEKGSHAVDRYLAMAGEPAIPENALMRVYLSPAEESAMQAFVRERVVGRCIALAPGGGANPRSSMPTRCWPEDKYVALGKLILADPDLSVVLIGGPAEMAMGARMRDSLGTARCVNTIGALTLRQTAALLKNCAVLVANDSAPMHIAAAVGTPTVSLFGPTAPYDKAPRGDSHRSLYRTETCSPCYRYGSFPDCKDRRCLENILPEEVMACVGSVIMKSNPGRKA